MLPVLLVAGALLVIAQLHRASGGVISVELHRAFGLDAAEIGLVIGAMVLASALAQIPTGLAFDRFGIRRTVSTMVVGALAGTLLLAVSTGFWGLAVGRFLIGAGFAGVVSSVMLLAMRWVPPERYATVASTALALGTAIGGLLATTPLALALQAFGWAPTYLLVAAMIALANFLVYALVRDSPTGVTARGSRQESLAESLKGLGAMLGDPDLRRVFAMAACSIAPFMCVGGLWAGPYLQDLHGFSQDQASYVLLGMVAMLNVGTLAYGPLDRIFGTRRGVVLAGAGATALTLGTLAALPDPPLWLVILLLHVLGLVASFYVTLTAHARSFVPLERSGRLITTISLFALSAAFAAQWLSGVLVGLGRTGDAIGSPLGYRLVFGFLTLMLLAALTIYRRAPEHPSKGVVTERNIVGGSAVGKPAGRASD